MEIGVCIGTFSVFPGILVVLMMVTDPGSLVVDLDMTVCMVPDRVPDNNITIRIIFSILAAL